MEPMEYLTDEELLALIETTESGELLTAPRDLKASVLAEAAKQPPVQKPNRRKQFWFYCLRVGLATAACVAILFVPIPEKNQQSTAPHISLSQQFNQFTDTLEQGFADINRHFSDFDFNFGGNRNE